MTESEKDPNAGRRNGWQAIRQKAHDMGIPLVDDNIETPDQSEWLNGIEEEITNPNADSGQESAKHDRE